MNDQSVFFFYFACNLDYIVISNLCGDFCKFPNSKLKVNNSCLSGHVNEGSTLQLICWHNNRKIWKNNNEQRYKTVLSLSRGAKNNRIYYSLPEQD